MSHLTYICVGEINLRVLGDWNVQFRPELLAKTNLIPVTSCTQLHYGVLHPFDRAGVRIVYISHTHTKIKLAVLHPFSSDTFAIQTLNSTVKTFSEAIHMVFVKNQWTIFK